MNKLLFLCLSLCLSVSSYAQSGKLAKQQQAVDSLELIEINKDDLEDALSKLSLQYKPETQVKPVTQTNALRLMLLLQLLQQKGTIHTESQIATTPTVHPQVEKEQRSHQTIIIKGKKAPQTTVPPTPTTLPPVTINVVPQKETATTLPTGTLSLTTSTNTTDTIRVVDRVVETVEVPSIVDFKRSVYFTVGSAVLDSYASKTLIEVIDFLRQYPTAKVRLIGFASIDGKAKSNELLAQRRTQSVVSFIKSAGLNNQIETARGGVDQNVSGYPLARRVDIELIN